MMTSAVHSHTAFLDAELKSALEEGNQAVDLHSAWLLETVEANTKNLRFQRCAQRLRTERPTSAAPSRAAHAPAGARQSPICLLTSRPPRTWQQPVARLPSLRPQAEAGQGQEGPGDAGGARDRSKPVRVAVATPQRQLTTTPPRPAPRRRTRRSRRTAATWRAPPCAARRPLLCPRGVA